MMPPKWVRVREEVRGLEAYWMTTTGIMLQDKLIVGLEKECRRDGSGSGTILVGILGRMVINTA